MELTTDLPELRCEDQQFASGYRRIFAASDQIPRTRPALEEKLRELCFCNAEFRSDLLLHPRAIGALCAEECLEIEREIFFEQVKSVQVIEEDERTLGIVLTECHYGCSTSQMQPSERISHGVCQICTLKPTIHLSQHSAQSPINSRAALRDAIRQRASLSPCFRRRLADSQCPGIHAILDEFGIHHTHVLRQLHRIRVISETSEKVGFVLHAPDNAPRTTPNNSQQSPE